VSCSCSNRGAHSCIDIVPIFHSLTEEEKLEIATITMDKSFEKGEMIYLAGDQVEKLFVIHTGHVKVSRVSKAGKEQVIRILGPGEFMGELALFSTVEITDNAEAIENSRMCTIEGKKLKELMTKYPSIAFHIIEELSTRLDSAENLIEDINLRSVEYRLAQALLEMANSRKEVVLKTTKAVFASQIGMSQETLSRKLTAFQEKGLIKQKAQQTILLLDIEKLAEYI